MIRQPPRSTPFPYPTLFRSFLAAAAASALLPCLAVPALARSSDARSPDRWRSIWSAPAGDFDLDGLELRGRWPARSEEHTSELQSRQYIVCRLLLEKKKIKE